MELEQQLNDVRGVGVELTKKFNSLDIYTVGQLIDYLPRRYDDFSNVQSIAKIMPGPVTVRAKIKHVTSRRGLRGLHITDAIASDSSGSMRLLWFNQPYRKSGIKTDQDYYISGNFELSRQRFSVVNPSIELASDFPINTARIVPIYRENKNLKSFQIRKIIKELIPNIRALSETLPTWLVKSEKLPSRCWAIETMHFPASSRDLVTAKRRLGFEEVFELNLAALLNKEELSREEGLTIPFDQKLARKFVSHLPFQLTDGQRKTVWRVYQDMQKSQPMNRLVEGDVGSGKTVVAAMAALMVIGQGFQVALMAPTEILARQHADTIYRLFKPLDMDALVGLLVGSFTPAQKQRAQQSIKNGDIRFMVGTQALIQEKVNMHKLGLIVIDEQHRFGVEQRKKLQAKAGHMPHVLHMTATPIPRSLALTLFGELDISIIDSKPANRKPIITKLCLPGARHQLYETINQELDQGRQVFVVCPLISESAAFAARSAEEVYDEMRLGAFKKRKIGLLHGKMKADDKANVMTMFQAGQIDLLVTTTVIEVGVDVPNASTMIIENAERFGLAQIHQLRGRVGRSHHQGYAYLMLGDDAQPSQRLRALERSNDGFQLAELDLELRGPGAIYGSLQHGVLDLRVAQLSDTKLITAARLAAQTFVDKKENLLHYSHLHHRVSELRAVTNLN